MAQSLVEEQAEDSHDHEHHENLAHHFDSYEQQFDAGKLGIWLFLVTEVLFFGGLFVAYSLYRGFRPDVFAGCSEFLNTKLGAINTGVLLFSSLTMAWAVRCAQLRQHKMLVGMLAATLSCAAIFLGVKSIEYSHKWEMGLLPAGLYSYNPANPHPEDAVNYLPYLCLPFALLLVVCVGIWLAAIIVKEEFLASVMKPLTVVCACFFVGVGLGMILESGDEHSHAEKHGLHGVDAHADHGGEVDGLSELPIDHADKGLALLAREGGNPGAIDAIAAGRRQSELASGPSLGRDERQARRVARQQEERMEINTPKQAGVFFGIYYAMTGVHAIHILAGMGVMVWLLIRAARAEFNENYFGPVDYVGLYWHLVDLIWIYLFPLLYLIG